MEMRLLAAQEALLLVLVDVPTVALGLVVTCTLYRACALRLDVEGLLAKNRQALPTDNDGRRAQEAERDEEAVPAGARMVDAVIWARALARRRARGPSRASLWKSSHTEMDV